MGSDTCAHAGRRRTILNNTGGSHPPTGPGPTAVKRRSRMPPDSGRLKLAGNADFTRTKSAPLWPVFLVVSVLIPPEMQRGRAPLVNIPPFGREYSRHRGLPIRCGLLKSAEGKPLRPVHRLNEPSGLALSMAASPQCRFRFARQNHCSVVFRHAQRYLFTAASMALPALAKSSGSMTG